MTSSSSEYTDIKLRVLKTKQDLYRQAAQDRGLSIAAWVRKVLDEETERQAALLLYRYRAKHPAEIDALVEQTIRDRNNR